MTGHKSVSCPRWKERAERMAHERNPSNKKDIFGKPLETLKDSAW
jgi:hypothetical protein